MLKKIIDITFWTGVLSTIMHFYVWTLVRDAGDNEFTKDALNMTFLSGGITLFSYWVSKPAPKTTNSDNDKDY